MRGGSASSEVSLEVRKERSGGARRSINAVVLVGDRNRCYSSLGNKLRSGYVSVNMCVFTTWRGVSWSRDPSQVSS